MTTPTLAEQIGLIQNLKSFSRKSGVPYRTLCRIKAEANHPVAPSTRLAIEGAIKRFKPKTKPAAKAEA